MNNFKDYGFEADFDGEILKKIIGRGVDDGIATDRLIGFIKGEYGIIKIAEWWDDGILRNTCKLDEKYNLKPVKKWYENPDNFPCIVISLKTNKPHIAYNYNHFEEKIKQETFSAKPDKFRPATKEEVLALLANA